MQWVTHEVWVPGRRDRRLRRLAARHEDDRRRPGGRAPTHVFCDMARGAGRRRRTVCLRHQFSRSSACTPSTSTAIQPTTGISLRQRSIVRGQALGWAVSLQRRASRGRGSPAYASAPAFLAGRFARGVHLRQDRPRSDLRGDAMTGPAMLESQRVRQEIRDRPHHRHEPRPRPRLRAVQSRDPAERICVRLPALLPAQPARLPGAGSHRSRQPGAEEARAGADLRTDCARYAIYRDGERTEDRTISPISGATIWSPS